MPILKRDSTQYIMPSYFLALFSVLCLNPISIIFMNPDFERDQPQ